MPGQQNRGAWSGERHNCRGSGERRDQGQLGQSGLPRYFNFQDLLERKQQRRSRQAGNNARLLLLLLRGLCGGESRAEGGGKWQLEVETVV